MIAPILRLVVTYLVLIAAVVAVFNRDKLATLFSGGGDTPAAVHAPATMAPAAGAPATPPAAATQSPGMAVLQPPTAGQPVVPQAPAAETATGPQAASAAAIASAVNAARAAFWSGDRDGARAQMQALARAHPDNFEILGELGNLQLALGDYQAAGEAFHQAGVLMIDAGQGARLSTLLPPLRSIAPDKAADLAARLQGR